MHIGKRYLTKAALAELFDLSAYENNVILLDPDGEEAECKEGSFTLDPQKHYTIVTEEDIDEEEDKTPTAIDKAQHIIKVTQIRRSFIGREWKPLHPWLYTLSEGHLHPIFLSMIKSFQQNKETQPRAFPQKLTESGLYHTEFLFSEAFCRDLIEEVDAINASGLPLVQPNTMNHYGLVLREFGFDQLWQSLLEVYLRPLYSCLYPELGPHLDDHHTFIVQYSEGEQNSLGFHYDDAEVTVNLCLGKVFTGGDLYFRGLLSHPRSLEEENYLYHHQQGQAVFHKGEHRHGALPIKSGSRYNLIIWYRSSLLRKTPGSD